MNTDYDIRLKKALENEHAKIFDGSGAMKETVKEELSACPVCDSKELGIYCIKDLFVHQKCDKCNFVFLNPRLNQEATVSFYNSEVNEVYNENKFHGIEEDAPDNIENLKNYKLLRENVTEVKGKKLLEIGCGKGTFLAKAASDGFDVYAIELNKLLIENLKKITPNIYTEDIHDLDLEDNFFDVIYFRDVIEHIPSIGSFLKKIQQILKPGGLLFIDTHNIDSVVNSITKEFHTVIFAFEHPVHWSPKTLQLAGERAGLTYSKVYFDHQHQSMLRILDYIITPSFTYIYPPKKNGLKMLFLKGLHSFLKLKIMRPFDLKIMDMVSKMTNRGSKMQVLFTKK